MLRAHGAFVSVENDGKAHTIIRDDFMAVEILEDEVRLRMVRTFARRLNIPIHHFFHPEEAESEVKAKKDNEPPT